MNMRKTTGRRPDAGADDRRCGAGTAQEDHHRRRLCRRRRRRPRRTRRRQAAGQNLGATVVIDNKAGAGGNIAHQQVAQGPTDGSVIAARLGRPAGDRAAHDEASAMTEEGPGAADDGHEFPERAGRAAHTGREDAGRTHRAGQEAAGRAELRLHRRRLGVAPGAENCSTDRAAGVDIVHIPYKGGAPRLTELLAGRLSIYFATMSTAGPHIAAGKLVPLATTG